MNVTLGIVDLATHKYKKSLKIKPSSVFELPKVTCQISFLFTTAIVKHNQQMKQKADFQV